MLLLSATIVRAGENYNGFVGGTSNQLGPDVGDVPGNRYFFDLGFDYHKQEPGTLEKRLTVNALYNDQNALMYSLNEAYLSHRWGRSQLQGGRFLLDWSDVDDHWGFGKINHRQNFNFFEPGREGLVGLIFKRRYASGIRYHLFVSPVYVPEMNPSLDINDGDGTITSKNPWAKPPAATVEVEFDPNNNRRLVYDVDYPSVSDVIYRWSGGVNLGWENKHWEAGVYYLRKPENDISVTVEVSAPPSVNYVDVAVTPQFYYHDVYGGNLRWNNRDVTVYVSAIAIRPDENPDVSEQAALYTQLEMVKRREDYVGGGISQENEKMGMGFNYVARLSPFNREDDILAVDPRWNQAVHGWGRYKLTRFFEMFADLKYDMLTTDRLAMWRMVYYPTPVVAVNCGVNMIGTPNNGKSFWSPFKNNDAVYAGLRYLF